MSPDAEIQNPRERIIAKAMKDPAFRAALLADSNGAVEKELGVKLPAGVRVKVVEDSASDVYLVLPPADGPTLSDRELETVAGGARGCLGKNSEKHGYCWDTTPCHFSWGPGF